MHKKSKSLPFQSIFPTSERTLPKPTPCAINARMMLVSLYLGSWEKILVLALDFLFFWFCPFGNVTFHQGLAAARPCLATPKP